MLSDICGQLISPGGFLHHRRNFEYHVLIFVTRGTLYISSANVEYEVSEGQYILLPAGEEHYGYRESESALNYYWVHFQWKKKETQLLRYGVLSFDNWITLYFKQLISLSLEESPVTKQMQNHLVSLCLLELERNQMGQFGSKTQPDAVWKVADWIKTNYYRKFTVAELAEKFGYQESYLSSLFKVNMGTSIVKYTREIRIKTAKMLLENCGISIKEAAYSCGFSDEKYFMKVFKQCEGMTPSEYRKAITLFYE